jgi:hypothetical protein
VSGELGVLVLGGFGAGVRGREVALERLAFTLGPPQRLKFASMVGELGAGVG